MNTKKVAIALVIWFILLSALTSLIVIANKKVRAEEEANVEQVTTQAEAVCIDIVNDVNNPVAFIKYPKFKENEEKIIGEVSYYVNADTLFLDKQFASVAFIYSTVDTDSIICQQSIIIPRNQEKIHNHYYVVMNNHDIVKYPNMYLSCIYANCYIGDLEESGRGNANAYMYDISKSHRNMHGVPNMTNELRKLSGWFNCKL